MRTLLLKSLLSRPATTAAPGPGTDALEELGRTLQARAGKLFGRSLAIREVDAGSCNGCELEIHALNNPVYDVERFGLRFVASPRHADVLLVTGPVTHNMAEALLRTWRATPDPKWVVAAGDCACGGGVFAGSYATVGAVEQPKGAAGWLPKSTQSPPKTSSRSRRRSASCVSCSPTRRRSARRRWRTSSAGWRRTLPGGRRRRWHNGLDRDRAGSARPHRPRPPSSRRDAAAPSRRVPGHRRRPAREPVLRARSAAGRSRHCRQRQAGSRQRPRALLGSQRRPETAGGSHG